MNHVADLIKQLASPARGRPRQTLQRIQSLLPRNQP